MIFIFTLSVCCCGLDMFAATPRSWLIKQKHLFAFKFKFMGNVEHEIPLLHVPVKVTFGNVLVWFLISSNGRGAGRLVCTTKWEINNRQTPNGAILLCQALFFFIFFQKPNQSSNTYLEEISSETTNLKPFDSIYNSENNSLLWIHRNVMFLQSHCFDFTLPFCQGFSLGFHFIVLTPSDLASATLSLINFFERYCKLNKNK